MLPYRIILAEDHLLFRQVIKKSIEEIPGLEVVGEAGDGLELLELLKKSAADLVILDISMPNLQGIEAAREIKQLYPGVKILVLTVHKSKEHVLSTIAAGADGYLLKENAYADLIAAIESIKRGQSYISSLVSGQLTDILRQRQTGRMTTPLSEPLSPREKTVLSLLAEGKSSKEIGEILRISPMTVNNHRVRIKKKLKIKTNAELIRYALTKGYSSTGK